MFLYIHKENKDKQPELEFVWVQFWLPTDFLPSREADYRGLDLIPECERRAQEDDWFDKHARKCVTK